MTPLMKLGLDSTLVYEIVKEQKKEGEKIEISSNLKEIVEYINNNKHKQISVIASGDPLIYGIGRYLSKNIDKEDLNNINKAGKDPNLYEALYIELEKYIDREQEPEIKYEK